MADAKAAGVLEPQASFERTCVECGRARATHPTMSGRPSRCGACWQGRLDALRCDEDPIKARKLHKNALACEYELYRAEGIVGRLILFRDSMTVCVRFISCLNGQSEFVLEETLKTLLGSWPHDYLDVEIIQGDAKAEGSAE